ncbi:hypothetical protein F511_28191 [Dorcoceras hygrometricum]|uniref:Uncharacterized protein n=1 Tax=Dorcoceras hygrometricum TaxID=472368 RepID=A0A2Z7AZR6_9LAMI|nr:hypothetical protein F511_28191 [Dorcoceras hygrometricum]
MSKLNQIRRKLKQCAVADQIRRKVRAVRYSRLDHMRAEARSPRIAESISLKILLNLGEYLPGYAHLNRLAPLNTSHLHVLLK